MFVNAMTEADPVDGELLVGIEPERVEPRQQFVDLGPVEEEEPGSDPVQANERERPSKEAKAVHIRSVICALVAAASPYCARTRMRPWRHLLLRGDYI